MALGAANFAKAPSTTLLAPGRRGRSRREGRERERQAGAPDRRCRRRVCLRALAHSSQSEPSTTRGSLWGAYSTMHGGDLGPPDRPPHYCDASSIPQPCSVPRALSHSLPHAHTQRLCAIARRRRGDAPRARVQRALHPRCSCPSEERTSCRDGRMSRAAEQTSQGKAAFGLSDKALSVKRARQASAIDARHQGGRPPQP